MLRTHFWIAMAIVLGAIVTALGYLAKAENEIATAILQNTQLLEALKEWAPHFGPELLVLSFATIFVEGALSKRERRPAIGFRTVQTFMDLVDYALTHNLYFDGGSSNCLMLEKEAISRRSERRRRAFWLDERTLQSEAELDPDVG